jgi:endonuclease YncB( thermonuclease family)
MFSSRLIFVLASVGLIAATLVISPLLAKSGVSSNRLKYSAPITATKALNGKSFVLKDGTIVRLASLQVPNIQETTGLMRAGEPMGENSQEFLQKLIAGKKLELRPEPPMIDRKGRRVAIARLADGTSVQENILRAGMGVVYPFPYNKDFLPEMLSAEKEARTAKRGIWSNLYWKPTSASTLHIEKERYQLVHGTIQKVATAGGNWYLNFGEDYKTDFTGFIQKADYSQQFRKYDLKSLQGKTVLLRGWVYRRDGVMMDIAMPEQIEVFE